MSQVNISMLTSYLPVFIGFFVLIICINTNHVLANDIYDQLSLNNDRDELIYPISLDKSFYLKNSIPEDLELTRRGVWSRLFRHENNPSRMNSRQSASPTATHHAFPNGAIHIIPFDKRTIPVELQKALYAHGIVGRRR